MHSNRNIPKLIQWWATPKLPKEHIFIPKDKRPRKRHQIFRVYSRRWLVHPIKRRIAKYYLILLRRFFGITVIAITGSTGKTTTKEMVASILGRRGKTVATYKNIDPVYNIPTTILKCKPDTKYLVLEMGVEFPGEMDFYLWLAKPSIGVITNIYPTHTQFLGSIKGVAKEKVKLIKALPKEGWAILNNKNSYLRKAGRETGAKIIWFGKNGDVKAESTELTTSLGTKYTLVIGLNRIDIRLPIPGEQFVQNSLAAASVGQVCQLSMDDIKKGLASFSRPEHRMRTVALSSGTLLLDDSYNNNPAAAKEALKTLTALAGRKKKILVFGDMLELGRFENKYHRKMGKLIASEGIDYLIGVGSASKLTTQEASRKMKKGSIYWVANERRVDPLLLPLLKKDRVLLVKGSQSIGLDKLVTRLS